MIVVQRFEQLVDTALYKWFYYYYYYKTASYDFVSQVCLAVWQLGLVRQLYRWALYGNCIAIYVWATVQPDRNLPSRNSFQEIVGRFTFCARIFCFRTNTLMVNRENLLTEMTCESKWKTPPKRWLPYESTRPRPRPRDPMDKNSPLRGEWVCGLIFREQRNMFLD